MEPTSLPEMDRASLLNRVDTKYVFNEESLQWLFEGVRTEYRVLTIEQTRLSPYSTLYFDSPDCTCFLQHHNGKLNRYKFRVREYLSTGCCFLEVKKKNNKGRTEKQRIPIQSMDTAFSANSTAFFESVVGSRLNLSPQLWTFFSRITLVHRKRQERVTLDCDLKFRFGDEHKQLPGIVIAEVKQDRDDRYSAIRRQLRRQHINPMRVSKYCLGTTLLKPHLKSNRFKSQLLAIKKIA